MQMSSPQWGFNGGALIEQLRFNAPLTSTDAVINPQRGVGPGSFSRASASYITDFEGITRKVESGSVGVEGSRIVTNLLTYSEDLSNAAWVKSAGVTGYTGGRLVTNGTQVSGSDLVYNASMGTSISGVEYRLNFFVKSNTASTYSINIQQNGVGAKTVSVTPTLTRYNISYTGNGALGIMPIIRSTGGAAIDITFYMQIENVTSQTNTNPGEYVKTTTAAVTKCFSTTNANTVNGTTGVVTEATGTALPQSYPDRANSTAYTVGQKIQASGWWYTCTTGGTSHSSAPTWLTGKTGLVTVSDNDVVWTIGGRLLLGYVSEPASTNKVTAYGIIPADTLGSELITVEADRTFASDTGWWAKIGTTTIADGVCRIVSDGASSQIGKSSFLTIGKVYSFTYTIVTTTSGSITLADSGGPTLQTTPGTYTITFTATSSDFTIKRAGVCDITFDNISIKVIEWAVGTTAYYLRGSFRNPITGLTLSGSVAAVLSIVTDETEIEKAGLANINPTYKVYKLDNSGGSVAATVMVGGTPGNTNAHTYSAIIAEIAGTVQMKNELGTWTVETVGGYARYAKENIAPGTANDRIRIQANAAGVAYFLLPQLEEQPFATSLNPSAGSTSTRAATVLSYPVAGNLTSPLWSAKITATPMAASQDGKYMLGSYYDANNGVGLLMSGANAVARKRIGGSNNDATKALTLVAGTTKRFGLRGSGAGWSLLIDSVKGTDSANTATPAAGTTLQIGLDGNSGNGFTGYFRDLYLYNKPLADGRF